jgi:hypothetical protein
MLDDFVRHYKALDGSLRLIDLHGCPGDWEIYRQPDPPPGEYPDPGLVEHYLLLTGDGHYVEYKYMFEPCIGADREWFVDSCVELEAGVAEAILHGIGVEPPRIGVVPPGDPRWVLCFQADLARAFGRSPNTKGLVETLKAEGKVQDSKPFGKSKTKRWFRIDDPVLRQNVQDEVEAKEAERSGRRKAARKNVEGS